MAVITRGEGEFHAVSNYGDNVLNPVTSISRLSSAALWHLRACGRGSLTRDGIRQQSNLDPETVWVARSCFARRCGGVDGLRGRNRSFLGSAGPA
jgi:hypothetical protein